jgi:CRP/FNR family transcriptional regulator, cyclic AMP receptor protein
MGQDRIHAEDQAQQIKLLSEVDILESFTTEEIAWLSQRTPQRCLESGAMVYRVGDAAVVLYLLLEGRVRLYGISAGQEFTFEVVQAGTIFGETSLAARAHPEYAQALEPARVGLLNLNLFWQLVRQKPEATKRVVKLLVTRSCMNRSRMTDLAVKEVPARLASLILELCQSEGVVTREGLYRIGTYYTHEQLATMIGAKRVSVSRAFGKLQDSGSVQLLRRQIYVVDLATLKQQAAG